MNHYACDKALQRLREKNRLLELELHDAKAMVLRERNLSLDAQLHDAKAAVLDLTKSLKKVSELTK